MKRSIYSAFLLAAMAFVGPVLTPTANAQTSRVDVRGMVADSVDTVLPGATVVVLTRADSVLSKFDTTDGDGAFRMRRVPSGEYILQVTFVGYQTHRSNIVVGDENLDVGTIKLAISIEELGELVVSSDHIPFVVSRDTLDYNARAFATRPNASVEDLLRRLPGIQVDADGTIVAQGEDVQKVLVDGKEFFGSDPSIATKNLPADAIERVQVYDKQSDVAEFTGIEDGEEQKTINLELKEEAKTGVIGNVTGGAGSEEGEETVYEGRASVNRFSPNTQLSFIANVNNINRPGFAWSEVSNFVGGAQNLGGSGIFQNGLQLGTNMSDGFSETMVLGLNASREFGKDTWIRTSYFLSDLENRQDRIVERQELLGSEISSNIELSSKQSTENLAHNLNVNAQARFSEGHDLRFRGDIKAGDSELMSGAVQQTSAPDGLPVNSATTAYNTAGNKIGGSGSLIWRKKLSDNGRSLFAQGVLNLNDNDVDGDLVSDVQYFTTGILDSTRQTLQNQLLNGNSTRKWGQLAVTEPLAEGHTLKATAEIDVRDSDQEKSVYDVDVMGTPIKNTLLSNGFDRTYTYYRAGGQYNHKTDAAWISVGLQVQFSDLQGVVVDQSKPDQNSTQNNFTHLRHILSARTELAEGKSLQFNYRTTTNEPTINQMSPFADNSNPLNIIVGNPGLIPEYRHFANLDFRAFDRFNFTNLFVSLRGTYTKDKIASSQLVNQQLQKIHSFVNSDKAWNSNLQVTYGRPIRMIGVRVSITGRVAISESSTFVNLEENVSRISNTSANITLDNRVKEIFDVRGTVYLSYNSTDYSLNPALNLNYLNTIFSASGSYYLGTAWTLTTDLNYSLYDKDVFGDDQNLMLWNASVGYLMKNNLTEIELVAQDLLNQNEGINITNAPTFIQNERIESLGRFFLLRIVHRLGGPGSKR
jgi:hypothetical protein